MGFADLVRNGVALADSLTKDLQASVTLEAGTPDTYGAVAYGAKRKKKAIVDKKLRMVRGRDGREVASSIYVAFLQPATIGFDDRITLPDGSTSPILSISGFVDAGTGAPYFAEVWLA